MSRSIVYRSDGYFEAVVQIRPVNDAVLDFLVAQVNAHPEKVEISRVVALKEGVDVYLTSQRYARSLGKVLKRRFPTGELVMTRTLHTFDRLRSKKVYRVTVCFRLQKV